MFDETTSAEYPEHADFIHNKAIPTVKPVNVIIIKAEKLLRLADRVEMPTK